MPGPYFCAVPIFTTSIHTIISRPYHGPNYSHESWLGPHTTHLRRSSRSSQRPNPLPHLRTSGSFILIYQKYSANMCMRSFRSWASVGQSATLHENSFLFFSSHPNIFRLPLYINFAPLRLAGAFDEGVGLLTSARQIHMETKFGRLRHRRPGFTTQQQLELVVVCCQKCASEVMSPTDYPD